MYSRRAKESHRDTVSYEIDMLRFSADRLERGQGGGEDPDTALALEVFLLHYRNLVRFFSGKHHRHDDISMSNCEAWAGRQPLPDENAAIRDAAATLDDCYYGTISQYLQHCTSLRYERDRSWDVRTMLAQLTPIIDRFERAFPR
jgi:hypothetical protein